jgi:hypothetical protein
MLREKTSIRYVYNMNYINVIVVLHTNMGETLRRQDDGRDSTKEVKVNSKYSTIKIIYTMYQSNEYELHFYNKLFSI